MYLQICFAFWERERERVLSQSRFKNIFHWSHQVLGVQRQHVYTSSFIRRDSTWIPSVYTMKFLSRKIMVPLTSYKCSRESVMTARHTRKLARINICTKHVKCTFVSTSVPLSRLCVRRRWRKWEGRREGERKRERWPVINVNAESGEWPELPASPTPAGSSVSSLSFASLFSRRFRRPGFFLSRRGAGYSARLSYRPSRRGEKEGCVLSVSESRENTSALMDGPFQRFSSKLAVFVSAQPTLAH